LGKQRWNPKGKKNWENRDGILREKKLGKQRWNLKGKKKIGGRNYLPCNLHKNKTSYQNFSW
jgi:hypothetical protein